MFNKKKKKWFGNKPHYKKGPDDANDKGPAGNINETDGPHNMAAEEIAPGEHTLQAETQDNFEPPVETIMATATKVEPANPQDPNAPAVTVTPAVPNCPICNMPIRSHYTAIRHQPTDELAHFDCVLRELSKEHYSKLGRYRKVYYIGAGNFAIVKEFYDKRGHFKSYEVVERLTYETKEK